MVVLVFAVTEVVARWAAEPIELGGGNNYRVLVVGPGGVPFITDADLARKAPELAVISVVAHSGGADGDTMVQAAQAALEAITTLDPERRALYFDMMWTALPAAARKALEMIPQGYQWQSEPMKSAERKGQAEALLAVLEARALMPGDNIRRRIEDCRDSETLKRWLRQAAVASTIDEALS